MSFPRHRRSIVRWGLLTRRGRSRAWLRPRLLTVSMSRSQLFLGELLSSIARLRFTGWSQLASTSRICKPRRRKMAHFSTGTLSHFPPELTRCRLGCGPTASIPGPQLQGTGGTLIVVWKSHPDRGHPPDGQQGQTTRLPYANHTLQSSCARLLSSEPWLFEHTEFTRTTGADTVI